MSESKIPRPKSPSKKPETKLPTAKPTTTTKGDHILRVVIVGQRVRWPLANAGATPAEVARAHRALLAQWPALVARAEAKLAEDEAKAKADRGETFGSIAKRWCSGELARLYPDPVKVKKTAAEDKYRFDAHVLKHVGEVPIRDFTNDDAKKVMAALPPELKKQTRRHVANLVSRVLSLAVYPLELITASPIRKGLVPKVDDRSELNWVFPDEEAKLVTCQAIPLAYRIFVGFLSREGMRLREATRLEWSQIDLVRGRISSLRNKTNNVRWWSLSADVFRALKWWRTQRPNAKLVFTHDDGSPMTEAHAAELYRAHLLTAGVDRAELHETTAEMLAVRIHDTRAAFISMCLATGRSESYITDRTGHRSSAMVQKYHRQARQSAEVGFTWFVDLDVAIGAEAVVNSVPANDIRGQSDGQVAEVIPLTDSSKAPESLGASWKIRTSDPRLRRPIEGTRSALSRKNRRLVRGRLRAFRAFAVQGHGQESELRIGRHLGSFQVGRTYHVETIGGAS